MSTTETLSDPKTIAAGKTRFPLALADAALKYMEERCGKAHGSARGRQKLEFLGRDKYWKPGDELLIEFFGSSLPDLLHLRHFLVVHLFETYVGQEQTRRQLMEQAPQKYSGTELTERLEKLKNRSDFPQRPARMEKLSKLADRLSAERARNTATASSPVNSGVTAPEKGAKEAILAADA